MKFKHRLMTVPLLMAAFSISGCVTQEPVIAGTPTPTCSPTPLADYYTPEIITTPEPKDELGNSLGDEKHYDQYLTLSDILIYEYKTGTFLDGKCTNTYALPLKGMISIIYKTDDGKVCGTGTIHAADGSNVFQPGESPVYAEILTDIDVTDLDYIIETDSSFVPVRAQSTD